MHAGKRRETICPSSSERSPFTLTPPFPAPSPRRLPVVAAVGAGCFCAVYSMGRSLMTNPEVHLTSQTRQDPLPGDGSIEKRAKSYKSSIYRSIQSNKDNSKIFG